jgi:hypothetical protein
MKQINRLYLISLGMLLFIITICLLTKSNLQEPFLTGFVDLKYSPPENSLTDQEQTYVNVNILKHAVVILNDKIEKNTKDISSLLNQVTTLTNQQTDLVSANTPNVKGIDL